MDVTNFPLHQWSSTESSISQDVLPAQNPLPSFEAITNRDLPRPSTGQAGGRSSESLSSGCTSRVGRSPRGLSVVSKSKKTGDEGMLAEEPWIFLKFFLYLFVALFWVSGRKMSNN